MVFKTAAYMQGFNSADTRRLLKVFYSFFFFSIFFSSVLLFHM